MFPHIRAPRASEKWCGAIGIAGAVAPDPAFQKLRPTNGVAGATPPPPPPPPNPRFLGLGISRLFFDLFREDCTAGVQRAGEPLAIVILRNNSFTSTSFVRKVWKKRFDLWLVQVERSNSSFSSSDSVLLEV